MSTSKSSQPSLIFWMYSAPTKSAPASCCFARLVAGRDDEHAHRLSGAGRQHDRAAHDLIGVARIDAQANGDFHRLIKLRECGLLDDLQRLLRLVDRRDVAVLRGGVVLLSVLAHQSTTSSPIERAAPATIIMADSIVSQLRSGILSSAILRTCALVTLPTLFRFG